MKRVTLKQIRKVRNLYYLRLSKQNCFKLYSHLYDVGSINEQGQASCYKESCSAANNADNRVSQLVCKIQTVLKLRSILTQVAVDQIDDKPLSARKIKSLKEAQELGFLTLFNNATEMPLQDFALYDPSFLFGDCFLWIFNSQVGYHIEFLLLNFLKNDPEQKNKNLFREMFFDFQNKQKPFFFPNKPVKNYCFALKRVRVLFNTGSLIRILRLIVLNYNSV